MSLLPKKSTPQEWEDIPLPGFDPVEAKPKRAESQREKEAAKGIRWTAYKGRRTGCDDCIRAVRNEGATSVADARHLRTHGSTKLYLCGPHAADRRDNDQLGRK